MTLREVYDVLNERRKTEELQLKANFRLLYEQAYLITIGFNDPGKFPTYQDEIEKLFVTTHFESKGKGMAKWQREKMAMTEWVALYNARLREKNKQS